MAMDLCAELTLRLVRLAQEHNNPRSVLARWFFFPEYRPVWWEEARDALTAAPKPLVVAPLLEPGALALWSIVELAPHAREKLERAFANQAEYFDEKLRLLGLADEDSVSLHTPAGEFALAVAEFRHWVSDYSVAVGVSVAASAPRAARLVVRPPGGGRPLGLAEDAIRSAR
jgi:hypothetical protein